MDIIEAYEFTLEKISELKDKGIEIEICLCPMKKEELRMFYKENPDIEKHGLPSALWKHVHFLNLQIGQAGEIAEMTKYLNLCGIQFDFGGIENNRDWALDWSFRYGKEDEQWVDAIEFCEKEIQKMNSVICN